MNTKFKKFYFLSRINTKSFLVQWDTGQCFSDKGDMLYITNSKEEAEAIDTLLNKTVDEHGYYTDFNVIAYKDERYKGGYRFKLIEN